MQGIYAIVNRENGKMYVGSARNIEQRWRDHRHLLRRGTHHSFYLQRAWDKYGESGFVLQVLETVKDTAQLRAVEQRWIDFLGGSTGNNGYNVHPVAAGGQLPGWTPPPGSLTKQRDGRRRGEGNIKAKLTAEQVRGICVRYGAGESAQQLAIEYGVSRSAVALLLQGKTWKHLDVPRYHHNPDGTGKWHRADKLTDADVLAIRERCLHGERHRSIAMEYGVSIQTVQNISRGCRKTTDSTI